MVLLLLGLGTAARGPPAGAGALLGGVEEERGGVRKAGGLGPLGRREWIEDHCHSERSVLK